MYSSSQCITTPKTAAQCNAELEDGGKGGINGLDGGYLVRKPAVPSPRPSVASTRPDFNKGAIANKGNVPAAKGDPS